MKTDSVDWWERYLETGDEPEERRRPRKARPHREDGEGQRWRQTTRDRHDDELRTRRVRVHAEG